ncbi:MAG TPA: alpha/beta hydrolase [Candidatus Paceibacterota bacterium]|nr:alpha/beta hydrolase [Candidatus Paceibacterota bacterium]
MKANSNCPKADLKRRTFRLMALFGALYLVACIGCASFQRRFIYFPPVFSPQQADEMAVHEGMTRWTNNSGKTLGWKRLSPIQPAQGRLLITHGNAGCALQCGHYADVIQQAAAFDVFVVEYPGYADLPGRPTEKALYQAADDAFGALGTNAPIHLVGESLGTSVAAYLAGRHPDNISGVALLAPYPSLAAVGQEHMRLLPVGLILRDRFPAEDHLRQYRGPVAILVADRDRVVPAKFGRALYESYSGPKRLWTFPEGDHGTVMTQPATVWHDILQFWRGG